MEPVKPAELGLAIFLMRTVRGWSQTRMAREAGITSSMLSEYERGHRRPSQKSLERLTRAAGVPLTALHDLIPAIRSLQIAVENGVLERRVYQQTTQEKLGPVGENLLRASLELVFKPRPGRCDFTPPRPEDRAAAPALWARLQRFDPPEQLLFVQEDRDFQQWALCELICHESVEVARQDPERALGMARLALRIAELAPGDDFWDSRLRGYTWAHIGNAHRASGDPLSAEEAFLRAGLLWRAGGSIKIDLLDEARLQAIDDSVIRLPETPTDTDAAIPARDAAAPAEGPLPPSAAKAPRPRGPDPAPGVPATGRCRAGREGPRPAPPRRGQRRR